MEEETRLVTPATPGASSDPGRPDPAALLARRSRLRDALAAQNLDVFLVSHLPNQRYLTGFTGDDSLVLVTPHDVILLTDSRYTIQAGRETVDVQLLERDARMAANRAAQLQELDAQRVGFEADHLLYSQFEDLHAALPAVELVATRDLVDDHRTIKDAAELATIRRAIAISDQAFDEVSARIQPGMSERQVARLIESRMLELGAEAPAFPTIVAAGPNGAMAHAVPSDRPIREGEPLVIDMGARYHGYNSDMTRTIVLGTPDNRFKDVYNIVLRAQVAAESAARSGLSGRAVDAAARDVSERADHGPHFGHGTGHGIGLEVHEPPRASRLAPETPLAAAVVISVEPGIYIEGWGGVRIEDLVLLSPEGAEVLTQAAKHGPYE